MKPDRLFFCASWLTVLFPVLLLASALADVALSAVAALFLVHCFRQRRWGWLTEGWVRILGLLWLCMIARGLGAEHASQALARALPFGRYIVFAAALARWTLADAPTSRRFLRVLAGFVILSGLDGTLQYLLGDDVFMHPLIHDPAAGHIRLDGPFSKPVLGIMLAWLAFPALLPLLFAKTRMPEKLAGVMVVLAAIALSGERMALLLTLAGCALAGLLLRLRLRLWLAGAGGIALLLGALTVASPDMFRRQVDSTVDTLAHWQSSPYGMLLKSDLAVAAQHPLLGLGANQFRSACETLYAGNTADIAAMCNTHPHNIYLEWLIEEGAIGLFLFAAFVAAVLRNSARGWKCRAGNPAFAGCAIAFALRVWPFMSTTDFFSRWGAPPFWLVLGALLAYSTVKGERHAGTSLPLQDTSF